MKTFLMWHNDKEPKDWDKEWGELPEYFEAPRFYVGDEICLLVKVPDDKEGWVEWEYNLRVKRVVIDIPFSVESGDVEVTHQWVYVKG